MSANLVRAITVTLALAVCVASEAKAQSAPDQQWSVDVAIGWDNSISGNINSSGVGTINNQTTVITKNKYEDVYGTGLHLKVGVGYMVNPTTEARATVSFQSLDADLTRMGDYGASNLYGQYDDYQSTTLDVGLRKYGPLNMNFRPYFEGSVGMGFNDAIDLELIAPQANYVRPASDFYDGNVAFSFGVAGGLLWNANERVGIFTQLGLRYVTGLKEVDQTLGTGLDEINDKSARWTVPFVMGVRFGF